MSKVNVLDIHNEDGVHWAYRYGIADDDLRLVLVAISSCSNSAGQCSPTEADLMRLTNRSAAIIRRNIAKLVEGGFIKVERRVDAAPLITLNLKKKPADPLERSTG